MLMNGWDELKKTVIDKGNCCLCGTCIGVCPVQTPFFQKGQIVNSGNNCIRCGRCVEVCPGKGFDFPEEAKILLHADYDKVNRDYGYYRTIYKGHATDPSIRGNASSGGVISALGCYLLEKKYVDYVIGVIGHTPETFFAEALTNTAEVKNASQSKYIFLPVNRIIRFIRENEGRYLYTGLPCQIQGIRKAAEQDPLLKKRIVLYVGLFCGFNLTEDGTEYLIKKSGIQKEAISSLEYRAKQNDETGFYISSTEKSFFISKHGYTILNAVFSRPRCWKCFDYTSEFADISFGDAWEEKDGWTRIICRTEKGEAIIAQMENAGAIETKPSYEEDIYTTQKSVLFYKKRDLATRGQILKDMPDYKTALIKQPALKQVKAILFLLCLQFGQTKLCRKILDYIPIRHLEKISKGLRSGFFAEFLRYLFWGFMTTAVNLFCFWGFQVIGLNYRMANLFTIILTKVAAYIFNKFFVFHTKSSSVKKVIQELFRFIATRGATAIIDYWGLVFFVEYLHIGSYVAKIIMIVIVTIMNYFLGKRIVYTD